MGVKHGASGGGDFRDGDGDRDGRVVGSVIVKIVGRGGEGTLPTWIYMWNCMWMKDGIVSVQYHWLVRIHRTSYPYPDTC